MAGRLIRRHKPPALMFRICPRTTRWPSFDGRRSRSLPLSLAASEWRANRRLSRADSGFIGVKATLGASPSKLPKRTSLPLRAGLRYAKLGYGLARIIFPIIPERVETPILIMTSLRNAFTVLGLTFIRLAISFPVSPWMSSCTVSCSLCVKLCV
jgi:hypothetical protein